MHARVLSAISRAMRHIGPFVLLLALLGCGDPPGTARVDFKHKPSATGGTPVVKFAGEAISSAELNQRFDEMNPYARARFQTVEQRKEYAEGLARFELLAREAVKRGFANDPEVVETAKRVMVQRLLRAELEEKGGLVSDEAVRAYYAAHKDDYVKPAMTRLAHIAFKKEDREKAQQVLQEVKALNPLDYAAFGKLARENSQDTSSQPLEGDLRFKSDGELEAMFGPELVAAAKGLQKIGEVAPELVETAKWLHVVKLQGRQMALDLSVEQAKPSIESLLKNEGRQERFKQLVEGLKQEAGYAVDEAAIAAIVVDPKKPAVESKGPQPGYVPEPGGPSVK